MRKIIFESLVHGPLTEPSPGADPAALAEVGAAFARVARRRFGRRFVASPRHADVLLVTGPVTKNMREALERTYNATPDPKWVVAVGDCAVDGGIFSGSYAVVGGVASVIPVDLNIPGCPPTLTQLLQGLLAIMEQDTSKNIAW